MSTLVVSTTKKVYKVASQSLLLSVLKLPDDEISVEERATLLLIRDLVRLGWRLRSNSRSKNSFEFAPPETYNKTIVRQAMAYTRNEILQQNSAWIEKHIQIARKHLARGDDVLRSPIIPRIEVCNSQKSRDLFRLFRYYWSSPYSEYVGRRIRLLVRDDGVEGSPVIGLAALGSSIIHIPDRDNWIGWDTATRTERIVYMMDAYVLGALPPYNHLLGGKLLSYILASNEVRQIYKNKYASSKTIIRKRNASDLALIVTTSLYGQRSSQYNRLKFNDTLLYQPIGETAGYGTLHISNETFDALRQLLEKNNIRLSHDFGDGANWRMRVIRTACEVMGLDSETILRHSFKRGLYAIPLTANWKEFLNGVDKIPAYCDLPLNDLVNYWRIRWLEKRKENEIIAQRVRDFSPNLFRIDLSSNSSL